MWFFFFLNLLILVGNTVGLPVSVAATATSWENPYHLPQKLAIPQEKGQGLSGLPSNISQI